ATTAEARGRSAMSLAGLEEAVQEAVEAERDAARLARAIGRAPTVIVLGRGYLYPAALETALKIKELARVWAEPYSSADFALARDGVRRTRRARLRDHERRAGGGKGTRRCAVARAPLGDARPDQLRRRGAAARRRPRAPPRARPGEARRAREGDADLVTAARFGGFAGAFLGW